MQHTHIRGQLRDLHRALVDILGVMNRPARDEALIEAARIRLDRALFPLLVGIERSGPIGVVELADRTGRDYTTVSRQVATLARLGLIARQDSATDRRRRELTIAPAGAAMIKRIDAAREKIGRAVFSTWASDDIDMLVRLMRRFADAISEAPAVPSETKQATDISADPAVRAAARRRARG